MSSQTLETLLNAYDQDHQHPWNRAFHVAGITMIGTGTALLLLEPPLALGAFVLGWGFQFAGHAIEGKRPSFSRDFRFMAIGAVWYLREVKTLAQQVRAYGAGASAAE